MTTGTAQGAGEGLATEENSSLDEESEFPSLPLADGSLADRVAELKRRLAPILSEDSLLDDPVSLRPYGRDWTRVHEPRPSLVVLPRTTAEVQAVMRACHALYVPVVPSGGRTGLAAGAVASEGEVVLSLEKMGKIGEIDAVGLTVRVEAGAITEAVHAKAAEVGLTWPVDFASKGSSQVGGNIATNAGGVKVIRYGLTRSWVLGLTVITAQGERLDLGGALEKDNTGVDLRQLFIGSEGILGVITEATLKLSPLPGKQQVLFLALPDLEGVLRLFQEARRGPFVVSAFELVSDRCLDRLKRHRGLTSPLEASAPYYVLIEVEAHDPGALEGWLVELLEAERVLDGTLAAHQAQAQALWALREGISESLSATGLPHKNDVALPIAALPAFCADLLRAFEERYAGWEICIFGHIGDGNLHINAMKPEAMSKEDFLRRTSAADHTVFELVQRYGGSISAEHGIGLLKRPYLGYSRSPEAIALLRTLKRALDPRGILNPGKVIPPDERSPERSAE